MTQPIAETDFALAAGFYLQALQMGAVPLGGKIRTGHRSARGVMMDLTGWSQSQVKDRIAGAVKRGLIQLTVEQASDASARGEIGAPPIPEIAEPPEGFVIKRNSGAFDAEGNLQRQWIESVRAPGDRYEIPAGHVVKGESALLDPSGRTLARWVKTKQGESEGLIEGLKGAFAAYDGMAPLIAAPAASNDDLLTVYPIPDLHLGMYAWGQETGADYDVDIAVAMATRSLDELVEQSRPSKHAVLLGLGDYFHQNDSKNATPGHGHTLDVDSRWPRVFLAGAKLATAMADRLARKHELVEVVFLPGNHDIDAAPALTVATALFFSRTMRITVNMSPAIAWYRRFGRCLLGASHGHTMKPDKMAMMLAADRAKDWGETKFRSFFFGHVHHETGKQVGPVRVESFSSPAARDGFNAGGGHRADRSMSAITFHAQRGEVSRHRVNILDDDS